MNENCDLCEILEWDTAFFGFRVGRVGGDTLTQELVNEIDTWCRQARVRCLYFLCRADESRTTRLAEDNSYRMVDIRLTLANSDLDVTWGPGGHVNSAVIVRRSRPADADSLLEIARASHHDSRFYFDSDFPRTLGDQLYETWLKQSLGDYADAVFVAELAGAPVGYITCHLDQENRAGHIGLFGVGKPARNQGVGRGLVLSALNWFLTNEAREVFVVTQGRNLAAQRLYQRCGFVTQQVQLWYHKWYPQ